MKKKPEQDAPRQAHELAVTEREQAKLLALYNNSQPFNLDYSIAQIEYHGPRAAESLFETGKHLLLIKEFAPHGEFTKTLEKLKIHPSSALRTMRIAQRFSNSSTLTNLDKSKLYLLSNELSDGEVEEAELTGMVRGTEIDKIATMSFRKMAEMIVKATTEKKENKSADKRENDKLKKALEKKDAEIERLKSGFFEDEQAMLKLLFEQKSKFNEAMHLLDTIDPEALSPKMTVEVIGLYEYMAKYAELEMLEARKKFRDPLAEPSGLDFNLAEQREARGRWEGFDETAGNKKEYNLIEVDAHGEPGGRHA